MQTNYRLIHILRKLGTTEAYTQQPKINKNQTVSSNTSPYTMIIKCQRKSWLKRKLKKVQVQMSDQCHSLLKEYANAWNMTMSEVMYECTRHHIHKHSNTCEYIDILFRFKDVKKDKRLSKDCYSCACFSCNHITSCRTGVYQGNWEINPGLESYAGTNHRN